MAVIYSKQTQDTLYQVRTAGNSIRLYSNGVLHSQYNPLHPISGAIWDLLLLPAFLINPAPKKILLLGLGGGTLVHLIREFFPDATISCIEIDKQHIHIAKTFFKIPKKKVTLIHGDAYEELSNLDEKFDWIIDDVFQHVNNEPERAGDRFQWLNTYQHNLTKQGLLSLNVIGKKQLEDVQALMAGFDRVVVFLHELYDNKIVSFLKTEDEGRASKGMIKKDFESRLKEHKALDQTRKTCRLQYKLQVLKTAK